MTTIETGFKYLEFDKNTEFEEDTTSKNYLLFFLKGDFTITCNQFHNRSFHAGEMILQEAMKQGITIQERLKDLRTERHLKLEELAAATKISKSALGSYENDELKEISHKNLVELAKFYGVSTDYLLCLTENRNHPGMYSRPHPTSPV